MNTSEKIIPSEKQSPWFRQKWFRDLVLFTLTVVWFGTMARFGFDPHHDGIMLGAAAAIAQGKLLFKEVFCQYGPLAVLIQSVPVFFWGAEDIVIKWTTVFFYGLSAVVGTRVWERFLKPPFLWIWYACFFMLCPFYLVPFHPWSSVYALFFMLLGVEWQLRFFETEKGVFLAGAGLCACAAFLCRTPCGLVAFAAGIMTLFLRGIADREAKLRFNALIPYAAGFWGGSALFALYLTCAGAWGDYLRQCYGFIFGFVVKRGGSWSWEQFSDSMIPLTGASGYGNCIFALLPLLAIGAFFLCMRALFYGRWEELKKKIPLIAVLLLALGSWHQYFPVPCVRHLYWAGIPLFGVYALTAQGIWALPRPKSMRILFLSLLAIPLLYCFHFRMVVLCQYFEKMYKRVNGTAPVLRNLWIFPGENDLFNTLNAIFVSLPPEIRQRGVLNHTPDGVYSCLFPAPPGFKHPMFVNWGSDVYPDYAESVEKLIREKRCIVLSTQFTEIPGYVLGFGFKHFEKEFRLFIPEN